MQESNEGNYRQMHLGFFEDGEGTFDIVPCPEKPEVPRDCHVLVREIVLEMSVPAWTCPWTATFG